MPENLNVCVWLSVRPESGNAHTCSDCNPSSIIAHCYTCTLNSSAHSTWIPVLLMTYAHFAISSLMKAANCSGVVVLTSAPWFAR